MHYIILNVLMYLKSSKKQNPFFSFEVLFNSQTLDREHRVYIKGTSAYEMFFGYLCWCALRLVPVPYMSPDVYDSQSNVGTGSG